MRLSPFPQLLPFAETWPSQDGAAVLIHFAFVSGETLPEVLMHYTTLGTLHKDKKAQIDNAIMVFRWHRRLWQTVPPAAFRR
ncbi:MAG: hypothetical protein IPO50_08480 [Sphingomonadales bacterium]|nr:hypothetical protein [Sphingomonadales bacterium]